MRRATLPAVLLLLFASAASAQSFGYVTPYVGFYLPLAPVVKTSSSAEQTTLQSKRQVGAGVLGARVAIPWGEHLSIETTAAFSPSMVAVTDEGSTVDVDGRIGFASTRLVFRWVDHNAAERWALHGGPGIGVVRRGGLAWRDAQGTTDVALVVGGGGVYRFRSLPFAFRVELENYMTWAEFAGDLPDHHTVLNHDLIFSLGFTILRDGDGVR